ncbi:MAG: hypothetical protein M1834_004911 [Cirrosporium novae-zelandiae]|nr:MAG: hypothetical protein M1834_004911 [Cirrosporium novae-zelandiae]
MSSFDAIAGKVVDEESATLNIPGEMRIPMDADHRTICKFGSKNTQNYQSVMAKVQDLANGAIETIIEGHSSSGMELQLALPEKDQKYYQSLHTSDYNSHLSRICCPIEGTSDSGCGKTVLSSFLFESLSEYQEKAAVCFFFLKDDNSEQKSIVSALSAILHQLICKNPSLIKHFNVLWDIFIACVLDDGAGEIICIIDALDECPEVDRKDFIKSVTKFFNGTNVEDTKLKFILTSRPYSSTERDFFQVPSIEQIRIRAEDEFIHTKSDIERIVKVRVGELAALKHLPEEAESYLIKTLCQNAGNNFLWVTMILDMIEQSPRMSRRAIERILSSTPAKFHEIYEEILSKSTDLIEAKRLLHIVVGALRPLTLDEVNIALNIRNDDRSIEGIDLEPSIRETIKNLRGLFLRIIDNTVYFVHQTAREFLIASNAAEQGIAERDHGNAEAEFENIKHENFDTTPAVPNEYASGYGVNLSLSDYVSDDDYNLMRSLRIRYKYLDYAAGNWFKHSKYAGINECHPISTYIKNICNPQSQQFKKLSLFYRTQLTNSKDFFRGPANICMFLEAPNVLAAIIALGLDGLVPHYIATEAPNLNCRYERHRHTLLHASIAEGFTESAVRLIKAGVCIEIKDSHGITPIHLVSERLNYRVLVELVENGAAVDTRDDKDNTPLQLAIKWNLDDDDTSIWVIKYLLDSGADVNALNCSLESPLFLAVRNGNLPVTRELLARGVDVESLSEDCSSKNPLHMAVRLGDFDIANLLLSYRFPTDNVNKYGNGLNQIDGF